MCVLLAHTSGTKLQLNGHILSTHQFGLGRKKIMPRARIRKFLILILLLSVAGQAVASSNMTCASMADSNQNIEQTSDIGTSNHSQHQPMQGDNLNDCVCSSGCDCAATGCSFLVPTGHQPPMNAAPPSLAQGYSEETLYQFFTPPFRPPIII
jgi:hypothetical protein